MREDMKHVIIDRPRIGGEGGKSRAPKGSGRHWRQLAAEDYPKFESTARRRLYGWHCKQLNEHLAPLRRWLRSHCGRPWDAVFSEICDGLSVRNATTAHVRDHAEQYVLHNTRLLGGAICDSKGDPIDKRGWHLFYVDPRDGTLQEAPRWTRRRYEPKKKDYVEGKDDFHQFRLVNGIWFEVELAPFPQGVGFRVRDVLMAEHFPTLQEAAKFYGCSVYAKSKRQLGKAEIRKRRLRLRFCSNLLTPSLR
jgi:hypothetical protein